MIVNELNNQSQNETLLEAANEDLEVGLFGVL